MGKGGRLACIFVPMALTVVALIFLVLIGLGQTNSSSYYLSNLYFLRANATGAAGHLGFTGNAANNETASADIQNGHIVMYNAYSVGLWNYCAGGGMVGNATADGLDPASKVAFCTGRDVHFAFNPVQVWGLDNTFTTQFFSKDLNNALNAYENGLAKAIGPLYIVTVVAAGVQIIIGLFAVLSRIGSLFTTLSACFTTICAFAFAVITTIAYFSLEAAFNEALDKEGFHFDHGAQAFAYTWLAVVLFIVGTLFWAFSSCCCSGENRRGRGRGRGGDEKGYPLQEQSYGYQRMGSPNPGVGAGAFHPGAQPTAYGPSSAPVGRANAYEPYRQQ